MSKSNINYYIYSILIIFLVFVDQMTKQFVVSKLDVYEHMTVIDKFFYIHYVRNTGSAFSFLANVSWGIYVLSAVSTVMALVILYFLFVSIKINSNLLAVSLTLLFAGATGNLIDRFRIHYVVDFLRFDFGTYTFPIFNVADICAVIGTFLVIYIFIFKEKDVDMVFKNSFLNSKKEV